MLYDAPEGGANTPFIPPLPSPESVHPPTIPPPPQTQQDPGPAWAQQPRTAAHYPYYPSTPYNTTPFIPPIPSVHVTPAMPPRTDPPGSYFPAPTALPNVYGPQPAGPVPGVSADYTGYPNINGTPWAQPAPVPPPQAWPPPLPPGTGYAAFQQPLPPGGPPVWGPPVGYAAPAATPWAMPIHPPGMTPYAFPAATPWMPPTNPPPPAVQPNDTARANVRWTSNVDRMNPFTEGPHYGPVLMPFLAKVVGAVIKINPLLAPPDDSQDDYIRWNMLFHTSNCHRTSESRRSWMKGRKAPATHPRLTDIRIVSRAFPWMIHIRAQDKRVGVTCGEVLDGISHYMYGDVAKREYESVPKARKRGIWAAYQHNRSTDPNVPGGGLGEQLKRLDWLEKDTMFGGLVINNDFVADHCGGVLPATFELKCTATYPLTQQELRDQQARLHHHESTVRSRSVGSRSHRSRSRASSHTAEEEEEEEEEEE
ncbi:hypothetical protein ID866_9042 [Astraeus odoratus]|nr:hypothetical protein ID866_9042 [Astraeus odoratus]